MAIVKFPGKLRRFSRKIPIVRAITGLGAVRAKPAREQLSEIDGCIASYNLSLVGFQSRLKNATGRDKLFFQMDVHNAACDIASLKIARLKLLLCSSALRKGFKLSKPAIRNEITALEKKIEVTENLIHQIENRAKLKPVE